MRGGERDAAREGRRGGENTKTGYMLFTKATTPPKTSGSPCPNNPPKLPLSPSLPGKMGQGGGLAFFVRRRFPHCRRKGETIMAIAQLPGKHSDKDSPERRCFLLPASFSYLNSHASKSRHLKTHGHVPGRVEPTAFVHKVQTTTASVWTARGRNTHGHTDTHTRAHTHAPCTGATMHRNTKVTTSINTSHYEYCFQGEAIHGIKTSTRRTPLTRTETLTAAMEVTTAHEGSTECP